MGRLLVLILLVVLAVWLLRRALRGSRPTGQSQKPPLEQQDLVRCARCGLAAMRHAGDESDVRWACAGCGRPRCVCAEP